MTAVIYYTSFMSPFCEIILAGNEDGLTNLHLQTGEGKRDFEISGQWIRNDDLFAEAVGQIREYFAGTRKQFDIKLNPQGTEFQKMVWAELCKIPWGSTMSYKGVAERLGNAKAGRAVGMANSRNPIPLVIPCHRVVGADGSLAGFAHGVKIKRKLIDLESKV